MAAPSCSRKETAMPSSTSSFERVIPARPWRGIVVSVFVDAGGRDRGLGNLLSLVRLRADPERHRRPLGRSAPPGRARIARHHRRFAWPGSISTSTCSKSGLGKRPVQLAQPGSAAFPVLADLVKDKSFHGTIICSVVREIVFCAARIAADESFGESSPPLPQPDLGPARQPSSRHLSRAWLRLHETGGPDSRRAARATADPEPA